MASPKNVVADSTEAGRTKAIVLLKPHTHEGRDYDPGAKLTLTEQDADWLISIESAELDNSAVPAA